jgi:hypothetical protein
LGVQDPSAEGMFHSLPFPKGSLEIKSILVLIFLISLFSWHVYFSVLFFSLFGFLFSAPLYVFELYLVSFSLSLSLVLHISLPFFLLSIFFGSPLFFIHFQRVKKLSGVGFVEETD